MATALRAAEPRRHVSNLANQSHLVGHLSQWDGSSRCWEECEALDTEGDHTEVSSENMTDFRNRQATLLISSSCFRV